MKRVFILGDLTRNVGDLLLRRQLVAGVRRGDMPVEVLAGEWHPPGAGAADAAAPVLSLKYQFPTAARRAIGAHLVVGPGQMLRDNISRWHLTAMAALVAIARATGGSARVLGVGIGATPSRALRGLWRVIFALSEEVAFRDPASQARASQLFGRQAKFSVTADLIFLESPNLAVLGTPSAMPEHDRPLVVAPCHDPGEGRRFPPDQVVRVGGAVAAEAGAPRILFVAHDVRDVLDAAVVRECRALMAAATSPCPSETLISAEPENVLTAYRDARLIVTNRLHSALLGVLAGKPVLVVEDAAGKLQALAREFGLPVVPRDADAEEWRRAAAAVLRDFDPTAYRPAIQRNRAAASGNFDRLQARLAAG
jgi:polysaccharide pyruvyl transferase WcaK-like protein